MHLAPLPAIAERLLGRRGQAAPQGRGQPLTPDQVAMLHSVPVLPFDEHERLAELSELGLADAESGGAEEALVHLAAQVCNTPMAALSVVDATKHRYLARVGIPVPEVRRNAGFCSRAILAGERWLEVPDASRVAWFDPHLHGPRARPVGFYAGVPLRTREGSAIGVLCVMDAVPRKLTPEQRMSLERIARAITVQLGLRRQLRIATQTDRLTGLPNWLHFEQQFEAARPAHGVACFVRLKAVSQIASAHGFRAADTLIRQAGERLREFAPEGALLGRIKRGLFVVFLPDVDADTFDRVHAPLLAARLQAPFDVGELTLVCPLHLGFASYPRDGSTLDDVVNAADAALQVAIERDQPAAFFDRSIDPAASSHYRLEPQLRSALARDEFVNHYQPKVDVATGRIVGVEALIRWMHPGRGLVPPAEFVPALEATGLIRDVGRQVLRRAAADWVQWRRAGLEPPRIAVNVAAAQLRDGLLMQQLREVLAATGCDPSALGIEVTESVLIGNLEQAIEVLSQVRALGVPVAIDDFGTGYSSLSYLVTLPVDEVKIDRSFVRKIATEPAYRGIVATCVRLAHNLHLQVVAEGVETQEQARVLRGLRCNQAQGFLYGAPVAADAVPGLLRQPALVP
jgi:predicted signal transduction protein with EAL and GGDEF domain